MAVDLTRRKFVGASAAVGGGLALGGPISALGKSTARGQRPRRVVGYGDLQDAPEQDSGEVFLRLPKGFRYRIISREGQPMSDGNPTPGIFDGTGCYPGPHGTVILIRNHENRSRANEVAVQVPHSLRYDNDPNVRGGNTKLVIDRNSRQVLERFAVLGGTHTNCAGGVTPWGTWITCEEIFNYGSTEANMDPGTGVPHGFAFEVPADAEGPVDAVPIRAAGRFSHEAVAWLDFALYETEDRGDSSFYRFIPRRRPREWGDLATFGGTLQALVVRNRPNFDADVDANQGESFPVEWVTIDDPNPDDERVAGASVRTQAQAKGAAIFNRCEGIWASDRRVYFDCTEGGDPAHMGQVWEYTPRGRDGGELKLLFESPGSDVMEQPDNLVVVPATGDVFLQEDQNAGGTSQFIRGVTRRGEIYNFAESVINSTEFAGGCFSPDGHTFFVHQQGDRVAGGAPDELAALTYAIWGPFEQKDDRSM
jgi:secreted PhoX family phosphatase